MTAGPVNRALLESFFQSPGQVYDDAKTEGAFDVVADQLDDNWNYLSGLANNTVPNPAFANRQALINGNFDIWQRSSLFSSPSNNTFTADRFFVVTSGAGSPTLFHSRQATSATDITGAKYFYRINTNGSGLNTLNYALAQTIENGTRIFGGGKEVNVSFWAKSNIAGKKLGVRLVQNYGTGGSPSANETISGSKFSITSSWARYNFTFTTNALTGKTFGTNNNDFLRVDFGYTWDASNQSSYGDTVTETFVGAGNIDLAQVQLCLGNAALAFQPAYIADELARCQRYYEKSLNLDDTISLLTPVGAVAYQTRTAISASVAGTLRPGYVSFRVKKRVNPTITLYSPYIVTPNAVGVNVVSIREGATALNAGESGFSSISIDNSSSTAIATDTLIEFHYIASAELQ